jgi:hypothetical protein
MVRLLLAAFLSTLPAFAVSACGAFSSASDGPPDGSVPPSPPEDAAVADGAGLDGVTPPVDGAVADAPSGDGPRFGDRILFTTLALFNGKLGGIAGADAKCQAAAQASPKANVKVRSFGAWLSTADSSAASRFSQDLRPVKSSRDEVLAAGGWPELASAMHATELLFDETGGLVNNNFTVWTGTAPDGTLAVSATTCASWTSLVGTGITGDGSQVVADWTLSVKTNCVEFAHLYCLEK